MVETDEMLLKRYGRGDETAFEALFLRHYPQVYRVLYGLMGSREAAEDLAQETFLALYDQPPRLVAGASLPAWLCRVAINRGFNMLRSEQRARQRIEQLYAPPPEGDPQTELLRAEERRRVQAALAGLPERQSKLLLLRHSGLSYAEIAAVIEVAPGSVGTLLARAERAFVAAYETSERLESNGALGAKVP